MVQQRRCLTCDTPFDVPATSHRKYCSTACRPTYPHSRRPRTRVTLSCALCGSEFERKAWEVKQAEEKGWQLYCSVECRDAVKRGRRGKQRLERVQIECETCGRTLEVLPHLVKRRRYCSRKCANSATGRGRKPSRESKLLTGGGYVNVYVPPDERPPGYPKRARWPEHQVVVAKMLGRWPTRDESIHHINGDKTDNRLENLQLRRAHHGNGHLLRCRHCGSSDIEAVELD